MDCGWLAAGARPASSISPKNQSNHCSRALDNGGCQGGCRLGWAESADRARRGLGMCSPRLELAVGAAGACGYAALAGQHIRGFSAVSTCHRCISLCGELPSAKTPLPRRDTGNPQWNSAPSSIGSGTGHLSQDWPRNLWVLRGSLAT